MPRRLRPTCDAVGICTSYAKPSRGRNDNFMQKKKRRSLTLCVNRMTKLTGQGVMSVFLAFERNFQFPVRSSIHKIVRAMMSPK